ncbi:MAG: glutamine ABC transporter substrate-binding protein, partial [Leuconostoc falkenbergense]
MFKKGILISFLAMLSITTFVFAMGDNLVHADKPNYIISTDATYPPFDFQDKNNQYVG